MLEVQIQKVGQRHVAYPSRIKEFKTVSFNYT